MMCCVLCPTCKTPIRPQNCCLSPHSKAQHRLVIVLLSAAQSTTFCAQILYSNVSALFLLPKPDGVHMSLCITLEHALRQGQTTYPYVVMQLPREQFLDVSINLGEQELTQRFGDKLDQSEQGDMPSVLAKVPSTPVRSLGAMNNKAIHLLRRCSPLSPRRRLQRCGKTDLTAVLRLKTIGRPQYVALSRYSPPFCHF